MKILIKKQLKYILFFILIIHCKLFVNAQSNFQLNGNAVISQPNIYQLTPDINNNYGSMWYKQKADLNADFDMSFELFFGNKDSQGADGITFAFQGLCTNAGTVGGGIGIKGISPSLFVEFDTYQNIDKFENEDYSDPYYDHIAIMKNGNMDHASASNLAGPVQASSSKDNIEDNLFHRVRINWNATSKTLFVYFDNQLRTSYKGDIVKDIFGGNPYVYWGFTSSTGGLSNLQQVKILPVQDKTICQGESTNLIVTGPQNGVEYNWSPALGLNKTTGNEVIASPKTTTTYTVVSSGGNCGDISFNYTINVIDTLPKLIINPQNEVCQGDTTTYAVNYSSGNVYNWTVERSGGFKILRNNAISIIAKDENYTIKVAASNTFCKQFGADTAIIKVRLKPKAMISADSICNGDSVALKIINPQLDVDYIWSPTLGLSKTIGDQVVAKPLTSTKYTVKSTGGICGNFVSDLRVNVIDSLPKMVLSPKNEVCKGDTIKYNVLNQTGNKILWYVKGNTFNKLTNNEISIIAKDTSFSILVTNENKFCKQLLSDSAKITVRPVPNPTINTDSTSLCMGKQANFTTPKNAGSTYQWKVTGTNEYTSNDNHLTVTVQNETIKVLLVETNNFFCSNKWLPISATVYSKGTKPIGKNTEKIICQAEGLSLDAGSGYKAYLWHHDNQKTQTNLILVPGTYFVDAANDCGTKTDTFNLKEGRYKLPNIITPNNDSLNETLIISNLIDLPPVQLFITNRWGNTIYKSSSYNNNWDGGNCADGIYFYNCHVEGCPEKKGWVQIVR